MPTAYEVMKRAFGFQNGRIPGRGQLPDEALYLDWERGTRLNLPDDAHTARDFWRWGLMFDVGFVKKRIMPLADLAIQEIVGRVIDIGILTGETCSGHPFSKDDPSICLLFGNAEKEKEFVERIEKIYHANDIRVQIIEMRNVKRRGMTTWFAGIPKWFAEEYRLREVAFNWCCRDTVEMREVWRLFSQVLRQYDGKPENRLDERILRKKDEGHLTGPILEEVYQNLVSDAYLK